jgi:hypothetical protein
VLAACRVRDKLTVVLRHEAARGVSNRSNLLRSVLVSAANAAERDVLPNLLFGRDIREWGDQEYEGQTEDSRYCAPATRDNVN